MRKLAILAFGLFVAVSAASEPGAQTVAPLSANGEQSKTNENHAGINTQKFADGSEVSSDFSGKPAVLCMWGLEVAMLALGRQCDAVRDKDLNKELESSISNINHFIVLNSLRNPVTQSQVEARVSTELTKYQSSQICRPDLIGMYNALKAKGPASLRAYTVDMLSIPREPVINPCF